MLIYGILGVVSALLFVIFAKDHPPTPAGHEEKVLVLDGLKHILKHARLLPAGVHLLRHQRHLQRHLHLGGGDGAPKGLDISEAGLIGGLLMIGGIVGFWSSPPSRTRCASASRR